MSREELKANRLWALISRGRNFCTNAVRFLDLLDDTDADEWSYWELGQSGVDPTSIIVALYWLGHNFSGGQFSEMYRVASRASLLFVPGKGDSGMLDCERAVYDRLVCYV